MLTNLKKNLPCILIIFCIWIAALAALPTTFKNNAAPIYDQVHIYDTYEESVTLKPGDILTQSFYLTRDSLDTVSLAFSYDISVIEKTSLLVSFYMEEKLLVKQPLSIAACPQNNFVAFSIGQSACNGKELTIVIENTSVVPDGIFSVMSTTDIYKYQDYTEGCFLNEVPKASSILCSFMNQNGIEYYKGLTTVFKIIIAALIISRIIWLVWTWLQQRNKH